MPCMSTCRARPSMTSRSQSSIPVRPLLINRMPGSSRLSAEAHRLASVTYSAAVRRRCIWWPRPPYLTPNGWAWPAARPRGGQGALTAAVAILQPGQRLVQGAGIHVESEYRLDRGDRAPAQELAGAETARLLGARRGAQRPADVGHSEVADGREHVGAEAAWGSCLQDAT